MNEPTLTSLFINGFSTSSDESFTVSYEEHEGSILHGIAKRVKDGHYEVYIEERGVVIHCTKDKNGVLSCMLNKHGNPHWVNGISQEVAKKVNLESFAKNKKTGAFG